MHIMRMIGGQETQEHLYVQLAECHLRWCCEQLADCHFEKGGKFWSYSLLPTLTLMLSRVFGVNYALCAHSGIAGFEQQHLYQFTARFNDCIDAPRAQT